MMLFNFDGAASNGVEMAKQRRGYRLKHMVHRLLGPAVSQQGRYSRVHRGLYMEAMHILKFFRSNLGL